MPDSVPPGAIPTGEHPGGDSTIDQVRARQAEAALWHGQAALAAGDRATAIRWLDRAHRLATADGNVALTLAAACLGQDDARAAALFARVVESAAPREAWSGLAAARVRLGDMAGAARALGRSLRCYVLDPGLNTLAGAITKATGMPGWCALDDAGVLTIHATATEPVRITLDGEPIQGPSLPQHWRHAAAVAVTSGGCHLLGSPIDIVAIARIEGHGEATADGISGWAWYPGSPGREPALTAIDGNGRVSGPIPQAAPGAAPPGLRPLARPRHFSLPAAALAGLSNPIRVIGSDGDVVPGGPIMVPALAGPDRLIAGPPSAIPARRQATIVIRGPGPIDKDWLAHLVARTPRGHGIDMTVDMARGPGPRRQGPKSPAVTAGRDIVLLDNGTLVPDGWLARLRDAAYAEPLIGTVAPLSNASGPLHFPAPIVPGSTASIVLTGEVDLAAQGAIQGHRRPAREPAMIEIAGGDSPCLYIRHDCVAALGAEAAASLPWPVPSAPRTCARARAAGWRNLGLPSLFVGCPGAAPALADTSPGEAMAPYRHAIGMALWRAGRDPDGSSVILITHGDGGGVEALVGASAEAHRDAGRRVIVLRPDPAAPAGSSVLITDGPDGCFPRLGFRLPDEWPALLDFLRDENPVLAEVHHLLNHPPALYELPERLDVPYHVHVHDHGWFCARLALFRDGRYCGEPADPADCDRCVVAHGSYLNEPIGTAALRARSAVFLAGAARVVTPSQDTAARLTRHFPAVRATIVPHEDDGALVRAAGPTVNHRAPGAAVLIMAPGQASSSSSGHASSSSSGLTGGSVAAQTFEKTLVPPMDRAAADPRVTHEDDGEGGPGAMMRTAASSAGGKHLVCVAGAIGQHKGFDILLACARDAADRALPLDFVLVGHSIDDAALLATGRVFVTGPYERAEAAELIARQGAGIGFLPSIWPETWCLALTDLWQAGLNVVAFDLGAQADRIRRTGRGVLLRPDLQPNRINDALMTATSRLNPV